MTEYTNKQAGAPTRRSRPTRTSGVWVAALGFVLVLLLLAIFMLQNGQRVEISYLGADGHLPLGLAMLLSAIAGALLLGLAGVARVLQLRRTANRARKAG
jgi:putative membrane protein